MKQVNTVNRDILRIAVPSIISNITVPLLGLVDTAIVGHLGSASYIGAIAVGGMLFSMIYWIFGFLRMGTGGLTAQAYGSKDMPECSRTLARSAGVSLIIALTLIVLQVPIRMIAFMLIDASQEVRQYASTYFHICIWGAPAALGLYSFTGWFIGMQNSRFPMIIAISQNIINIAASLLFVFGLGMKVEGVALGTLIAQYSGLIMAIVLWSRKYASLSKNMNLRRTMDRTSMIRFFHVNRDIFLRTLCLVAVTVFFTSTGAAYGDIVLAVNTLMMQLFTLFSYVMDGFAYAGEALVGKNIGAGDKTALHETIRSLYVWGIGMATLFTLLYLLGGKGFLALLTDDAQVIDASAKYFYWAVAIPFASFLAFLMDGFCVGATATSLMLRAMFTAAVTFFIVYFSLRSQMGNHSLWLAFISYLAVRGIVQTLSFRKLKTM